ncbi:hypothetical protein V6Z11_D05G407900 [Gossypium hirsutum]
MAKTTSFWGLRKEKKEERGKREGGEKRGESGQGPVTGRPPEARRRRRRPPRAVAEKGHGRCWWWGCQTVWDCCSAGMGLL